MTRYRVTIAYDACTSHDVEADTEEGAIEAAMSEAGVTLCHQCSRELDLGDPNKVVGVEDLDTGDFNPDPDPDPEVVRLRARVKELEVGASRFDALAKLVLELAEAVDNAADDVGGSRPQLNILRDAVRVAMAD